MSVFKITLAAGLLLSAAPGAAIAQDSTALDPILACRGIDNDLERLACFDAAAADLGGDVEAGELVALTREEVEVVERESFGLPVPNLSLLTRRFGRGESRQERVSELERAAVIPSTSDQEVVGEMPSSDRTAPPAEDTARPSDEPVRAAEAEAQTSRGWFGLRRGNDEPSSAQSDEERRQVMSDGSVFVYDSTGGLIGLENIPVARVYIDGQRRMVVIMKNGQAWRQTGRSAPREPREQYMDTLTAELRNAALGSYLLKLSHSGTSMRVERVN